MSAVHQPFAVAFLEHRLTRADCAVFLQEGWLEGAIGQDLAEELAPLVVATRTELPPGLYLAADGSTRLVSFGAARGVRGLVCAMPGMFRSAVSIARRATLLLVRVPGAVSVIGVLAAKVARRPVLVQVVGDAELVPKSIGLPDPLGISSRIAGAIARWQVRNAASSWYVTERSLQAKYPPRGLSTGMSDVSLGPEWLHVYPGSNLAQPHSTRIAFVGSLEQRYKGLHVLLKAFAELHTTSARLSLDVVGAGRLAEDYKVLASSLGIADRIAWHGSVSREEVRRIVSGADLFVLPSLTEGMPRALIEAMALGVPCVGTRVGGIPELLPDELLCKPGSVPELVKTMRTILGDTSLRERYARVLQARAQSFSGECLGLQRRAFLRAVRRLVEGAA